jgi:hypothetical protein
MVNHKRLDTAVGIDDGVYEDSHGATRHVITTKGRQLKLVPTYATYSSVVSRDSVRLPFLFAALNDLNILSADIGNAFLNAPPRERCHIICGEDLFGQEHKDKIDIVVRALYGLKTVSAAWRHHFFYLCS